MDNSEITSALNLLHDDITDGIEALKTLLRDSSFSKASVFQLPATEQGEDLPPVEAIEPTQIDGVAAFGLALDALSKTTAVGNESTRYVFRLPGAISVETSTPDQFTGIVNKVNTAKDQFDKVAHRIKDEDHRFELLHTIFPKLIYPQLIRKLQVCTRQTKSVTFTWGQKPSSSTITVEQADNRLAWHAANPTKPLLERLCLTEDDLTAIAEQERLDLRRFPPDTRIRHRRDLRVRPLANLLFADELAPPKKQCEAHTPIIVLNSPDLKLGTLKPYDKNKRSNRKKRVDSRASGTPISKILPFFLE